MDMDIGGVAEDGALGKDKKPGMKYKYGMQSDMGKLNARDNTFVAASGKSGYTGYDDVKYGAKACKSANFTTDADMGLITNAGK